VEEIAFSEHRITKKPFYIPQGRELSIARASFNNCIPLLLKGPTGCGKSRFMQYLAWELKRPLITVSCHDDLSTSDLVGRYLLKGGEAVWQDGPLTTAVRAGGICYLDEIVEARKDTMVVIHPLADDRRELPIDKLGQLLTAPPEFMLAVSYNPGYQSIMKDLKQSTRQRFLAVDFSYPAAELETKIIVSEAGVAKEVAQDLVRLGALTRKLKDEGLQEGASTRLLIHAGRLIRDGVPARDACGAAITEALCDDPELLAALQEIVSTIF